ncbi:MAG TPA: hypothetical protein VNU26_07385 [Mycobacteriales bacterium]|nr:hypothetical protein [Mycobacteriales bacterium]
MTSRYLPICLVTVALLTGGCAAEDRAAVSPAAAAADVSADLAALHAETVALADAVLAADPDPATAEEVRAIRGDAAALLAQAGDPTGGAGALAAAELEAVRGAVGDEAVRLGLDALLRNQLAVVSRAKQEAVEGRQDAARAAADRALAAAEDALRALGS